MASLSVMYQYFQCHKLGCSLRVCQWKRKHFLVLKTYSYTRTPFNHYRRFDPGVRAIRFWWYSDQAPAVVVFDLWTDSSCDGRFRL